MSFGERAALEGVLAQVRPKLALELGTAEGGSLRRIAVHSADVHSIDPDHQLLRSAEPLPNHVNLHTGPGAELLPPLLRSFEESNRNIDFALVDGAHSVEAVRASLEELLRSPATRRTVILIHDSMNAEVRAGIGRVELDDYEKVVYHELDFLPGYTYAERLARSSAQGGFALVLTDAWRSPGYTESTRQSLYQEPFKYTHGELVLARQNDRLRGELRAASAQLEAARASIEHSAAAHHEELEELRRDLEGTKHALVRMKESVSWRATRPLRAVRRLLR